ncbi:hypothetical protein AD998_14865 [bacterium 336/3]|nr:hypothetical protein AD998_14865 [bacterium 336/3]
MTVHYPPTPHPATFSTPSVFLAGSIEMGKAIDWQQEVIKQLTDAQWNGAVLNPRRADWDSSWEQKIENPKFREQVEWELEGLEKATLIIFYFAPKTYSPITILELGLFAQNKECVVCCPEGFWRKGNIDIVCARYGVPQVQTIEELTKAILELG